MGIDVATWRARIGLNYCRQCSVRLPPAPGPVEGGKLGGGGSLVPRPRGRRETAWYRLLAHARPFPLYFRKIVTFT